MKDERILAYKMAQELTKEEREEVSGGTCSGTAEYSNNGGSNDYNADFSCSL
jgi:hypothetical protein